MNQEPEIYRQPDFRLTDSVGNLHQYSPLFMRHVPDVFLQFISGFLRRLQSIIGIEFNIHVPEHANIIDESVWPIFAKLEYLRKRGIVESYHESWGPFADEPRPFAAQVNLAGINVDDRVGMLGYGRSLFSQAEAWGPAFGEGIERWCSENFAPRIEDTKVLTTVEILKETGCDLRQAPGMSPASRSTVRPPHGYSHQRYDIEADTRFVCVKGEEMVSRKEMFFPLQFFSFAHGRQYILNGKEPTIHPLVTTGSAAGISMEEATLAALHEIIERDAFMLYWTRKITPKRIDLNTLNNRELVAKIKEVEQRYHLETHFMHLPTDFPVHIIVCALIDRTGKGVAVTLDGTAHVDIEVAIEKTFTHTTSFRGAMRRRYNNVGVDPLTLPASELKLKTRALWWYPPERLPDLDFFIKGEVISVPVAHEDGTAKEQLDKLLSHCAERGYQVFRQQIIPADIKRAIKTDVVWLKVPQLLPLFLEEWERLEEGSRLKSIPEELGLKAMAEVNQTPHPYS